MLETLSVLPPGFWVVVGLLVLGGFWASGQIKSGVGLPMLAVLATVAVWYAGDVLYNDYVGDYMRKFDATVVADAWWEVAWFLATFLILAPIVNRLFNWRHLGRDSQVFLMLKTGANLPAFQLHLNQLFWSCLVLWIVLVTLAAFRLGSQIPYYFFPFLGYKADPWGRGQIGGGIDALLSLAAYVQMFVVATFGVVAALAKNRHVRLLALIGCLLTWPWYIIDRTRNSMLAVLVPPILAWVFLRLRGGAWQKAAILLVCFLFINAWFGFVLANRSDMDIATALHQKGFDMEQDMEVHNEGLNMYEELCWINKFIREDTFKSKWGQEYFAEIANPIPRVLWPGKPTISLDYAVARGQEYTEQGTTATIATGMIGQGIINFGVVFGPAFAALLMSLWTAALVRLDLDGQKVGRIPLYALGIILTFNLGRDITLITLYTFIFGCVIVWWLERSSNQSGRRMRRIRSWERGAESGLQSVEVGSESGARSAQSEVRVGKQEAEIGNADMVKSESGQPFRQLTVASSHPAPRFPKGEKGISLDGEHREQPAENGGRHPGFDWWQNHQMNVETKLLPATKKIEGQ